jgi:glycosyltransferase involved in cell wall biosynthesis
MNILMLAPEPFFQPRGTPISVYFRLKALSDLGHRVTLVTYPLGEDKSFPGVRIVRIPRPPGVRAIKIGPSLAKLPLDALLALRAARELLARPYDLIFSHEEAGLIGVVLGALTGVPHLYDMHSSLPQQLTNFDFSRSAVLEGLFVLMEDFVLRRSRSVIVICRDLERLVRSKGFGDKAVFLENFLDFEPEGAGARDVARIRKRIAPRGEKIALYAGNFQPYQGVSLLLEGMARVKGRAVLALVGVTPADREDLTRRARELGLESRLVLVDRVAPAEVPAYIAAADVLVSPRVSGTNTPLKIYSFLRSGKPLVATNLWTHTQVVDGKVAILVEPTAESMSGGLSFALFDRAAGKIGRAARAKADREYTYPAYLAGIREALAIAAGGGDGRSR